MDNDKMLKPVAWIVSEQNQIGSTSDYLRWNRGRAPTSVGKAAEGLYSAETVQSLLAEANEQARLNGMGAEREARLMAQVAELQAEVNDLARRLCLSAEHEIATNRHVYQMEIERIALAKDAARYRWLRKHCEDTADEYGTSGQLYFGTYASGQLDAAIDAAMAEGER